MAVGGNGWTPSRKSGGKGNEHTGTPPRAAHFPNKATMMPPLGASTSSSVVDVAQSLRVRAGGNNLAGASAVLSNGDIVLVGATGPRGEEARRRSFAPGSTGASDYFASRLDAAGGDPLWRRESSSFAVNGLGDFVFTAVGATSAERTDSEGTGGVVGEAVLLGGCTEDRWNDAADPEEGSGSQHEIGSSGTHAVAVKLDASDGVEIWRFRDAAQGVDGRGYEGCILGVASDRQGDFFLVGYVIGGVGREMAPPGASRSDIDIDPLVIKLDGATGKVDWRLQHGTTSDDGVFFAGATDSSGNLIAAGYTEGDYIDRASSAGGRDYIATKFGPGGEELWRYQSGSAEEDEAFHAVAVDADGDVYLGGSKGVADGETSKWRPPVVVVHKLDGISGTLLWAYEGDASSKTIMRGVAVDGAHDLFIFAGVSGGGSEEGASLRGAREDDDKFALALVASSTGEQVETWRPGLPSARLALALAGVGPDGGITLAGCTHGNDAGGAIDLGVVRLPPRPERKLAAPAAPALTPARVFRMAVATRPTRGLRSTPAPTSAVGVPEQEESTAQGVETSGAHEGVTLAVVLGAVSAVVICALLVAYGYWRRRRRRRKTEENEPNAIKVEAAGDHTTMPPRTSCSTLTTHPGGFLSPVQGGGPLQSSSSRGDSPPRMCKIHPHVGGDKKVATSAQTASIPFEAPMNSAPGEAAPAAGLTSDESEKIAAEGAGPAAASRGRNSGPRGSGRDLSALASPENYGLFPQPFSDVRVPVHPYSPLPSASILSGAKSGGKSGHRRANRHSNHLARDACMLPTEVPEVDIADLVLDNNDYYARVANETSTLREAATVVAVAVAATAQGRTFEGGGREGGGREDAGSRTARENKSSAAVMSPVLEVAEASEEAEKTWAARGERDVRVQEDRGGGGASEDSKLEDSATGSVATMTTIESAETPRGDRGRNSLQANNSCDDDITVEPGDRAQERPLQKLHMLPSMFVGDERGGLPPLVPTPRGAAVGSDVLSRARGACATARGSSGGGGGRGTASVIEPLSAIENRIPALSSSSPETSCSLEDYEQGIENVSDGYSGGGAELSVSVRSASLATRVTLPDDGGGRESCGDQPAVGSPVRDIDGGCSGKSFYATTLKPSETREGSERGDVDRVGTVGSLTQRPSTQGSTEESELAAGASLSRSTAEHIPSFSPLTRGSMSAGAGALDSVPGCGSGQAELTPRGSEGAVTFDIDALTEAVGWWGKKRTRCVPTPGDESSGGGKISGGGGRESSLSEYARSAFFVCGEVVATPPPTESPGIRGGSAVATGSRCSSARRASGRVKVKNSSKHGQPTDSE